MKMTTKKLVGIGLFAAISVVLTRFAGFMIAPSIRLSFGAIPIILSGVLLGPIAGGLTGAAADIIGFIINPMGGAFHPGFTLSAALNGVLPALILSVIDKDKVVSYLRVAVAIGITEIVTSLTLNTLWLTQLIGKGFFVLLPMRVVTRAILFPIYTFFVTRLYHALKRI